MVRILGLLSVFLYNHVCYSMQCFYLLLILLRILYSVNVICVFFILLFINMLWRCCLFFSCNYVDCIMAHFCFNFYHCVSPVQSNAGMQSTFNFFIKY